MACKVGAILYFIVQAIAFVLIVVGTPIDMFRLKSQDTFGNTGCLTMWGSKTKCYSTEYDYKPKDLFGACEGRLNRFRAAEAFAIISIAVYGVAAVFGGIRLCCCSCFRWFCLILNIVGVVTACIVWAIMVDSFYKGYGTFSLGICGKLKDAYKYGAGFALFVTAWCLEFVALVLLIIPF